MFEAAIAAGALLLDHRLLPMLALTLATIDAPLLLPKSLVWHPLPVACLECLDVAMQHCLACCADYPLCLCAHACAFCIWASGAAVSKPSFWCRLDSPPLSSPLCRTILTACNN